MRWSCFVTSIPSRSKSASKSASTPPSVTSGESDRRGEYWEAFLPPTEDKDDKEPVCTVPEIEPE